MAPPNPFWVQRYLRDHNLDALLAEAVNQAVEQRSTDPAASLAQYFTMLSKRNGEVTKISARRTFNSDLKPAVELSVECFFNGGTRVACTTVGEPVQLRAPPLAEGDAEEGAAEDDGASPEERLSQLVDRTIENVNTVVGPALQGMHASATIECDDALKGLHSAPTILASLALAEAGAASRDEPLYVFVAKENANLISKGGMALGGGHLVEVPSPYQLLNEEEKPAPAEVQQEPAGAEGEEGEREFVPRGQGVKLPVIMVPALACGVEGQNRRCSIKQVWLMTKRDEALKVAVPKVMATYRHLKSAMEAKAAEAAAAPPEEGAQRPVAPRVMDDDGFLLVQTTADAAEMLGYIEAAVGAAGLAYGDDITVCCNLSAQDYFVPNSLQVGTYCYKPEGEGEDALAVEADDWAQYLCTFLDGNPAVSALEDVAANEDYETWRKVRLAVEGRSSTVTILGAAIFDDNIDLYRTGTAEGWAAGAVLRVERLGTLSDVVDSATIFTAIPPPSRALRVVLAHRPGARAGEADADIAVGIGAWAIKSGPPAHSSIPKLNRLIWIEEDLARMQHGAEHEGLIDAQTAHLISWEKVYASEEQALSDYASAAQEAEQGP